MDPEVKWRLERAREYGRATRDAFLKKDYGNAEAQQAKQEEADARKAEEEQARKAQQKAMKHQSEQLQQMWNGQLDALGR